MALVLAAIGWAARRAPAVKRDPGLPSHANLLSGDYPLHHGVRQHGVPLPPGPAHPIARVRAWLGHS